MRTLRIACSFLTLMVCADAAAEPYFAVREGLACAQCHTNPTGGGQRTPFGNAYVVSSLAGDPADGGPASGWTGEVLDFLSIGGDARIAAEQQERNDQDDNLDFFVQRITLYGSARVNQHLSLYVDQQIAPGGSLNREAWIKVESANYYVKAGRLFVPFGWRLEDNTALARQATGVSMLQGDDGLEIGYGAGRVNAQLAITNGAGGAPEQDDGKQISGRLAWVSQGWQAGLSVLDNNTDLVDRRAFGFFAGLNTGPIVWLAEYARTEDDDDAGGEVIQDVGLLEGNWQLARGHNLKLTLEYLSFDDAREDQARGSLVYEWTPFPFGQLRIGFRGRDSDEDDEALNSELGFVELHAFF